ncbi:hypothetical protein K435DRAFT_796645 [Dendrothele bispora CBS 962.96]|uniref:Uncharacterized protein n=1 Tax=Dendrothele bispora (strain CBS 962.96) TaxID=1314807 RepID=A0A4S8M652_DENBC|nr:hypothetical protein K435DRAFT_796645 [Dendrothele bispora CBS 962.96]
MCGVTRDDPPRPCRGPRFEHFAECPGGGLMPELLEGEVVWQEFQDVSKETNLTPNLPLFGKHGRRFSATFFRHGTLNSDVRLAGSPRLQDQYGETMLSMKLALMSYPEVDLMNIERTRKLVDKLLGKLKQLSKSGNNLTKCREYIKDTTGKSVHSDREHCKNIGRITDPIQLLDWISNVLTMLPVVLAHSGR